MLLGFFLFTSVFPLMLVTTRFQVSHGEWPQVNFDQLPLVPTHQKPKGKEPIFDQPPKGEMKIGFNPSSHLSELNTSRASSHLECRIFEQYMLFTRNKEKSTYAMITNRLLWECGVEKLRPWRNHKDIYGTTLANISDRDLHGGNQHYSPFLTLARLSPKPFHPMDDKIRQDELGKIAYLEK